LKQAGMTTDTILVEWSNSKFDYHIIRRFSVKAGDTSILPDKKIGWLLQLDWRTCLPGLLSMKLEDAFPLVYPGHNLVGKNHRAMPDVLMMKLMCDKYFNICV